MRVSLARLASRERTASWVGLNSSKPVTANRRASVPRPGSASRAIAASQPRFLDTAQIPADVIEAEKRVIEATMAQEQAEAQADSDRFGGFLKEMDAEKTNGTYEALDAEGKKNWDDEYAGVKKKFGGGYRPKPADILAKMGEGKIRKFVNDITLMGQPFVKNPDETVEKLLKSKNAGVASFVRLAVGEGIEKKTLDFAAEVAAASQV